MHFNKMLISRMLFQRNRGYVQALPILNSSKAAQIQVAPMPMYMKLTPKHIRKHLDSIVIGQDLMKKSLSVAIYNHYIRLDNNNSSRSHQLEHQFKDTPSLHSSKQPLNETLIEKSNILLIGPTGSGKTLISKATAQFLNVPFSMNDATPLTQAGYVGDDVESCIYRLLQNAEFDVEKAQKGIVFLDEIDKIAKRSDANSPSQRDVSGEGVQQGLLRILEGTIVNITVKPGARKGATNQTEVYSVDTSNILFICSGAFVGLDKIIKERTMKKQSIGFDAALNLAGASQEQVLSKCEPQDLVQFGFIPEFVGRIPVIANANELSSDELVRILTEPKNAIVSQYQALFKASQMELRFTSKALHCIAQQSSVKKTGARGLRRIMETLLMESLYEFPGTNVSFVVVHVNKDDQLSVSAFHSTEVEKANSLLDVNQPKFTTGSDLSRHGYKPIVKFEDRKKGKHLNHHGK